MNSKVNPCRHFRGFGLFKCEGSCAVGRDIRAWVDRCDKGQHKAPMLEIPCIKQEADHTPLFDCPQLDRETDEEIQERREKSRKEMDFIFSKMNELNELKQKMIRNKLSRAKATCPWCNEKDALKLSVAIGYNNHMHAKCSKCDRGIME